MATKVSALNPSVLRWARERSGFSIEDVAIKMGKDSKVVCLWEDGKEAPTYVQLEKLAYEIFKRPIAIFFFPKPPEEADPREEFRLVPEFVREALSPDSLFAIREIRAKQESLRELTDGRNPAERKIFRDVKRKGLSVERVSSKVREYLGISVEEQKLWKSPDTALKEWRSVIEDSGIFVFKRSFKQSEVSGFCLFDDEFPVICINNSTSKTRQIFTLFHELAHILFSVSGITKLDQSYLEALSTIDRKLEIFCNSFAAEFLVPDEDFDLVLPSFHYNEQSVERLASIYSVSREMILRKLVDKGLVDQDEYERRAAEWNEEFFRRRSTKSGRGNFYATKIAYLGSGFLRLAFSQYAAGRISTAELSSHLNIPAKNIEKLEDQFMRYRM